MKVLITGSSGLLGGRIFKFLREKNFKVISLNRKKNTPINFKSKKKIEKSCRGVDVIINCIGKDIYTSKNRKKTIFANAEIPSIIYNAGSNSGVKYFIYISTYHVYDFNKKKINENSQLIKKNLYTESKILGEEKIIKNKNKTKIIILRLCNLFGYPIFKNKNCEKLLLNYVIKSIAKKKPITINSQYDEFRYYSSIKMFNFFLIKILKNLNKNKFTKNIKILNYFTDKCYKISDLIELIDRKKKFKITKIKYKYKKLKKKKKFKLLSLDTNFLPKKDKYFFNEFLKTYNYYKNI